MWRDAHRFLAAGDDDVGIAVDDCLVAKRDRAQARAAKLIDPPSRRLDRHASRDRGLACGVLTLGRGQNLTHDDFRDPQRFDAGAVQRRLDGDLAKFMGRQRRECAIECADRRSRRTDNDDIVFHGMFLPGYWGY